MHLQVLWLLVALCLATQTTTLKRRDYEENKCKADVVVTSFLDSYSSNLLYHFLPYYRSMGVCRFCLAVHLHHPLHNQSIHDILAPHLPVLDSVDFLTDVNAIEFHKLAWNNGIIERYDGKVKWHLHLDVDEFLDLPPGFSLDSFLKYADEKGANAIRAVMVDRLGGGGELLSITKSSPLFSQFPLFCGITSAQGNKDWKNIFTHFTLRYKSSHKLLAEQKEDVTRLGWALVLNHFKWDKTLKKRTKRRLRGYHNSTRNNKLWVNSYKVLLDSFVTDHNNRIFVRNISSCSDSLCSHLSRSASLKMHPNYCEY